NPPRVGERPVPPPMATESGEERPARKQLQFKLSVREGDPLGSPETNTQRILAEPTIVALEDQSFTFQAGGQLLVPVLGELQERGAVPFGIEIKSKAGSVQDDKVRGDITVSNSVRADHSDDRAQVYTESTRLTRTVQLGQVVKFRVGKGTVDSQTWVELTVQGAQDSAKSGLTPAGTL